MNPDCSEPGGTPDKTVRLAVPSEPLTDGAHPAMTGHVTDQTAENKQPAEAFADPAMDEAAKQQFLWHVHQYLGEYARFGDTKAAFSGAIASALLGALYSAKMHMPLLSTSSDQWTLSTWLSALGGVFLLASVALAIWAVLPRLGSTQSKGFIYWDSIAAHGNIERLQNAFNKQPPRTLNDHLLHHVFDISTKVCIPKYRAIAFCIWALCIGSLLAAAALVSQDLPHKSVPASTPTLSPASVTAPQK
jgi:hypothetical protein